jgi:hypothetical protein
MPTSAGASALHALLEPDFTPAPDQLLQAFLRYVSDQGLSLYPAQEEAILELLSDKNIILATPTGSGKSLVASAAHFFAVSQGERSFYTCPVKALVSEKFFALCEQFGPERVGMLTGDASVNHDAPIVCCTAEILANMALRQGALAPVDHVIMDEFHYYADRERGGAWHIPLLTLPQARFLLMSATLGDTTPFEGHLSRLNQRATVSVLSSSRPVPLDFAYRETPLHETIADLVDQQKSPIYLVNFTQRACAEEAQKLMSTDFCTKAEKRAIREALAGFRFDSPYGKTIQRFVQHGIGLHHAGLLPKYRLLVEKLAQGGHLKVICGTDTLGVGVNIPIRTVVFTQLCKFDGEKPTILSARDFHQISGRAGRRGFDTQGSVVVQAPEHVIENKRMVERVARSAQKKKIVKRSPPDKGYVAWDDGTFQRLVQSPPEPLKAQLQLSHATVLNVMSRERGGCKALARLIRDAHVTDAEKQRLRALAKQLFGSLVHAGVLDVQGSTPRVSVDLQEDFALDQPLALYLLDTLGKLDRDAPGYELDVLSVVEAIAENPDVVLRRQLDKLRTEKMNELKAAGVEYEERIAELEKLEYPKPNRDFIYATFNEFASKHPWVGHDNIRPKGVAREMAEQFLSFADYVREYGLERSEGVLLRYLSEVYKILERTVPDELKTDELRELVAYLEALVHRVDSSLLEAWEQLLHPSYPARGEPEPHGPQDPRPDVVDTHAVTELPRGFGVQVRNEVFRVVRALALGRYDAAAEILAEARPATHAGDDPGNPDATANVRPAVTWTARRLQDTLTPYLESNGYVRIDAEARSAKYIAIQQSESTWTVQQWLLADEPTDWQLQFRLDVHQSRLAARPVFELEHVGPSQYMPSHDPV